MQSQPESTPQTVALFDDRPFFEKALQHGVQHGIIPAERLAATGYGEFHPLDARNSEEAYARNRRIELKLTSH